MNIWKVSFTKLLSLCSNKVPTKKDYQTRFAESFIADALGAYILYPGDS